jgi:hypothetical protein
MKKGHPSAAHTILSYPLIHIALFETKYYKTVAYYFGEWHTFGCQQTEAPTHPPWFEQAATEQLIWKYRQLSMISPLSSSLVLPPSLSLSLALSRPPSLSLSLTLTLSLLLSLSYVPPRDLRLEGKKRPKGCFLEGWKERMHEREGKGKTTVWARKKRIFR